MRFMFQIAKHLTLQLLIAKMYGLLLSYVKVGNFQHPRMMPYSVMAGLNIFEPGWFQLTQ